MESQNNMPQNKEKSNFKFDIVCKKCGSHDVWISHTIYDEIKFKCDNCGEMKSA